ncbi:MAG: hypothetical protein ACLFQB_16190 [Chitinispirillaceae bacterium]
MKLNTAAVASASGILWGLVVSSITWFVMLLEMKMSRKAIVGRVFRSHMIPPQAGIIAFFLGLVDGFLGGAAFSFLYNRFVTLFSGKRRMCSFWHK